jgi:hypothetical protein
LPEWTRGARKPQASEPAGPDAAATEHARPPVSDRTQACHDSH